MYSDRNLINRRNVKADVHDAYTQCRDFFMLEFEARVVAAAMKILGMSSIDSTPETIKIPSCVKAGEGHFIGKLYLFNVAKKIIDMFICAESKASQIVNAVLNEEEIQQINARQQVTPEGRYKCRSPGCSKSFKYDGKSRRNHEQKHDPPPVIPDIIFNDNSHMPSSPEASKKDDLYNYNCCLISYGLLFTEFLDAIAEGDGDRNLRSWKMLLLHFKNDPGSTKYALEALYYTLQVHSILTPRQAYRLMWNRSVKGGQSNVPLDLDLEHDNKILKEQVKKLGRNLTQKAVSRICKFQFVNKAMLDNYDKCIQKMKKKSGKHTVRSDSKDFITILNKLVAENVMSCKSGRSLASFPKISSDPLDKIDIHGIYKWINDHKKFISFDKKAR